METPAPSPADAKNRAFWAGVVVLLLAVALYAGCEMANWAATPLGQRPQGEAAAWLNGAEAFYQGETPREPFFRDPAYLVVLALMRQVGVSADGLGNAARMLNLLAHLASTALVIGIGLRFWRRRGALVAGALWGFYPPAIFLAMQTVPATLALLAWLCGAGAALGTIWQSPMWQGGRISRRHAWAYPFIAGVAFVTAACLQATLWPTALAWPVLALFLGRDQRVSRLFAALFGVGIVAAGLVGFQNIWGGSPQPLAGADLYRLARALEITQPWNAPLPTVEFSSTAPRSDYLELEAKLSYQIQTNLPPPGHAVLDGYWWRDAASAAWFSPARSLLRAARKTSQLFAAPNYSSGADYARARMESVWLKFNPLGWGGLLILGLGGLALGWRKPAAGLAVLLADLVVVGAIIWYPTMEARAPIAALLALFAGGLVASPWPRRRGGLFLLSTAGLLGAVLAWWPRRNSPAPVLVARDSRERAMADAALGHFDDALLELSFPMRTTPLTFFESEMAADWRFRQILAKLPARPSRALLEQQLLENSDLMRQSPSSQFRCGACLWMLGQFDGAIYYWENLADDQGPWGAAAREALALSGRETPADMQRRSAWEIGGGPKPDPALAAFFACVKADAPQARAPQN